MYSESSVFQCLECDHAPFDTKAKLNKHSSSKHRRAATFEFSGVAYPLAMTDDDMYACPTCKAKAASVRSLRCHMDRHRDRAREERLSEREPIQNNQADGIPEQETLTIIEPRTLDDIGFSYEYICKVAICDLSCMGSKSPNANAVLRVLRMHRLRPHLVIIWDDAIEDQLDESDDGTQGIQLFSPPAFRSGSAPLHGIPVQDGFKCQLCEQMLTHVCVTTKKGLRTHYKRTNSFYGRSKLQSQLRYVEVRPTVTSDSTPLPVFGIPDDVHMVPGHNSTITERKDLNQFGIKFQGYTLLDIVDLSDLGNLLHKTEDQSFEVLRVLCLRMLDESRAKNKAGFQPMLGKVMVGES
ncbi:uncharacterized protein V1513DRAFT_461190 [Lipomyces chichibuensis]|uniref:uncharacterized protein n=1 Tax=Lipomyces chichibuensis TaxID=1546026 RepID=UPI003343CBA5